jgi:tRNA(Ile)-lysidine synthetase-like protein
VLHDLDSEVLGRVVRLVANQHRVVLTGGGTAAAVEFIKRGRSGAAIDLSRSLRLGREFDALWFGPAVTVEPDRTVTIDDSTSGTSLATVGGRGYEVSWGTGDSEVAPPTTTWRVAVSRRSVRFPLTVRGPKPGDRIALAGGTRKLKKLFGERRVPRSERARTPVLQEESGRILWVAGLATARDAAAGADETGLAVRLSEASTGSRANERSDVTETRG